MESVQESRFEATSDEKAIREAMGKYGDTVADNVGDYGLIVKKFNPKTKRFSRIYHYEG